MLFTFASCCVINWKYEGCQESHCSKFIHQIMNCLSARNSFITKFTSKFLSTLSSRSVYHIGVIQKYVLNFFLIHIVGGGVQMGPLGTSATEWSIVLAMGDYDAGEFGGMKIGRGNRSTRRKPAPAPLCPPQISLDQTQARTRAAAVGSQRLTAWTMARPKICVALKYSKPCLATLLTVNWEQMAHGADNYCCTADIINKLPCMNSTARLVT
jgi:hypothetical protein